MNYQSPDICRACGGRCCKHMPGAYHPSDFGLPGNMERFRAALLDPQIAIDWWEGDPRGGDIDEEDELPVGYFLRPAIVGVTRKFHAAWEGRCVFLGDGGCKLPHSERPHGCRAIEPRADDNCVCHDGSKHGAAMAWLPYFDMIDADQCEGEQAT